MFEKYFLIVNKYPMLSYLFFQAPTLLQQLSSFIFGFSSIIHTKDNPNLTSFRKPPLDLFTQLASEDMENRKLVLFMLAQLEGGKKMAGQEALTNISDLQISVLERWDIWGRGCL